MVWVVLQLALKKANRTSVRKLREEMERALNFCRRSRADAQDKRMMPLISTALPRSWRNHSTMPQLTIAIDLDERFEHLEHAPITEAVIEVRGRAESSWEEEAVTRQLRDALPEYPQSQLRREVRHTVHLQFGGPERLDNVQRETDDLGWSGVSLRSADQHYVVVFDREVFACSRLQPYETWERFLAEATRLWQVYQEVARPSDAQRIGLRFINQIQLPAEHFELSDFLVTAPNSPNGLALPYSNFFHHDTFAVPGHPFGINFIQTIQPPAPPAGLMLILDIDVFTTQVNPSAEIVMRLAQMRWLKNKLFFGSLTPKTLQTLR